MWASRLVLSTICLFFQQTIVDRIGKEPKKYWSFARRILANSNRIHSGVTGAGGVLTIQAEIVRTLILNDSGEQLFFQHACDPDPTVAGYCIDELSWMSSDKLGELPNSLFSRKEYVHYQSGCLGIEVKLGELATLKQRGWLEWKTNPDAHKEEIETILKKCEQVKW